MLLLSTKTMGMECEEAFLLKNVLVILIILLYGHIIRNFRIFVNSNNSDLGLT